MKKQKSNKLNYFIHTYLANRPAFFSFIRPQEALLFDKNKKIIKSPILDFGCGDGFFAQLVFEKKLDIGLDLKINPRVWEAKKNKIYKKITLYDGKKIPYPSNHFQTVISNCVLEHIPNIEMSLQEIYRILKPGGYFITSVMTNEWENYFFGSRIFGSHYIKFMKKKQEHYNLFSIEKWKKTFLKTNFKIAKITGYLSPNTSMFIDIFHYLSIFSLLSYKLFKKWVLFPKLIATTSMNQFIEAKITKPISLKKAAGLFFILKK